MGLRRYRQLVRSNIGSVQVNSLVDGSSIVDAMSISSSDAGDLQDGSSVGGAMSISGSDTGDLQVLIPSEVALSGTETDDPGVTTFREEFDITVPVDMETEDCRKPNAAKDFTNTTQLQIDAQNGRTFIVSHVTKEPGSGHVQDSTGESMTLVDHEVAYRRATGLKLQMVTERFICGNLQNSPRIRLVQLCPLSLQNRGMNSHPCLLLSHLWGIS